METKTKTKSNSRNTRNAQEPRRLSKAGEWRRNNPEGIFVIVDRKAVMK